MSRQQLLSFYLSVLVCVSSLRRFSTADESPIGKYNRNRLAGGKVVTRVRGYGSSLYGPVAEDELPQRDDVVSFTRQDFPSGGSVFSKETIVPHPSDWFPTQKNGRGCKQPNNRKKGGDDDNAAATQSSFPCVENEDDESKVNDDKDEKDDKDDETDSDKKGKDDSDEDGGVTYAPTTSPTVTGVSSTEAVLVPTSSPSTNTVPSAAPQEPILIPLPTEASIPTQAPVLPTSSPTDASYIASQAAVCANVINQNSPDTTTLSNHTFQVTTQVQYREAVVTTSDIQVNLDSMNTPMALWMADCSEIAMGYLFENSEDDNGRALQDGDGVAQNDPERLIDYAEWTSWETKGSCPPTELRLTCETFQSELSVFLATNETSNDLLVTRILEAFKTFDVMLLGQDGLAAVHLDKTGIEPVGEDILEEEDGSRNHPANAYIGVIVGFIAASLAVILSLLCIIRRKLQAKKRLESMKSCGHDDSSSSESSLSESHLTEGSGKIHFHSVYATGTASTVSTPPRSLVGDVEDLHDEPVSEPRGAWISEEALFWLNHPAGMDSDAEHVCSAATCRTCEIRRQQGFSNGLQAQYQRRLKPPTPPRPTTSYTRQRILEPRSPVYDDSRRWYMFDDTVEL